MFNDCLTEFLNILHLTLGSCEGLAPSHWCSLTPSVLTSPGSLSRVMPRLVIPSLFPATVCTLVSSTKEHSASSWGTSTCSILCPLSAWPGPGAAPWVASQLSYPAAVSLCPDLYCLQTCFRAVSTFVSSALPCSLPDSTPPSASPEFPPTGCVGSVLSTTRELELFFSASAALKHVLCKKGWNESLYFLGSFPGHAFPCLGHSLSQRQPPTTFNLGYTASLLSDGIRGNKLSFLAGICFRDKSNPLVCICIKQEGDGIVSHSYIRLNTFAYK